MHIILVSLFSVSAAGALLKDSVLPCVWLAVSLVTYKKLTKQESLGYMSGKEEVPFSAELV